MVSVRPPLLGAAGNSANTASCRLDSVHERAGSGGGWFWSGLLSRGGGLLVGVVHVRNQGGSEGRPGDEMVTRNGVRDRNASS